MRYTLSLLILLQLLLAGITLHAQAVKPTFKDTFQITRTLQLADTLLKHTSYDSAGIVATQVMDFLLSKGDTVNTHFASALEKYGLSLYYTGKYPAAIPYYRRSLAIQLNLSSVPNKAIAFTCYRLGLAFNYCNQEDSSTVWHQKALDLRLRLFQPDDPAIAESYNGMGMSCDGLGDSNKAIEWYEKARDIWEKSYGHYDLRTANAYNNLGISYAMIGEDEKSIQAKKTALDIRRKVLGPMNSDVAASCMNLGYSYQAIGQYDIAEEYYAETRKIWDKVLPPDHPRQALIADNTGINLMDQGDYYRALPWLAKALRIRRLTSGDNSAETGKSWVNLGIFYVNKGQYDKAIQHFTEAVRIFQDMPGNEYALFITYSNLGVCYSDLEQYAEGLAMEEKALSIGIDLVGEPNSLLLDIYYNIGIAWQGLGNWENALLWKQKAHDNGLALLGESHRDYIQYVEGLAYYYRDKGQPEKAIPLFEKALDLHTQVSGKNVPACGRMLEEIGNTLYTMGQLQAAKPYFGQAKVQLGMGKPVEQIADLQVLVKALRDDALTDKQIFKNTGNPASLAAALSGFKSALQLFDLRRSTLEGQNSFSFWHKLILPIQENAIQLANTSDGRSCIDCNQTAFDIAEDAKAFQLYTAFKKAEALHLTKIPDSLLVLENDLRRKIADAEKVYHELAESKNVPADSLSTAINGALFGLRRDYEALQQLFEKEFPEYYRLKYSFSTASLQYVQDSLLEPQQALLEYFVGDSSIYLFVVRADTFLIREVKRDFPLEDWIEQLRQGLYGYYAADKTKQTAVLREKCLFQYLKYAQNLYEKLFAPVEKDLLERVIIVPDGPLGYIPFDALLTGVPEDINAFKSYPYLFNSHEFSYTYSATLLKEMRDKKHHREPAKEFAAFAPFYSGDTLIINDNGLTTRTLKGFHPLPYTKDEVDGLHKIIGGDVVTGTFATEPRFVEMAGQYRILHLATHGVADNRVGDYAFLAFSEIKDSIENELLYVKDLYNLEINADMVVLSACETGIGKLQQGEGIISLSRALAYAGAKSIISTLWEVNDKSTAELMRYFYTRLQEGATKDQALRSARKDYFTATTGRGNHPFFWAAFVPVGDMRPVFKAKK